MLTCNRSITCHACTNRVSIVSITGSECDWGAEEHSVDVHVKQESLSVPSTRTGAPHFLTLPRNASDHVPHSTDQKHLRTSLPEILRR